MRPDLFWDDACRRGRQARLDHAREQIGKYHEAIVEVETRREAISEEIKQQDVELDFLQYDLQDIIETGRSRQREWVLERDDAELPRRAQVMPWARGYEEDRRFRMSLGSSLAAALAFILLIGMIVIPLQYSEEEIVLDERIAKLVIKERALPPPPPPAPSRSPKRNASSPRPA